MGPSRGLRRGFSLEVIFEEDSDFCSHLDSLDSVNGAPIQYPDQISVDSLIEEEEYKDKDKEKKKNYYIVREQDNYDYDYDNNQDPELTKIQLLLRQPHQYQRISTSPIESTSFDAIFHLRDMESCLLDWDQSGSSHHDEVDHMVLDNGNQMIAGENNNDDGARRIVTHKLEESQVVERCKEDDTGDVPLVNNGRLSRVSRREILSASWLTKADDDDDDDDDQDDVLTTKTNMTVTPPFHSFELGNKCTGQAGDGLSQNDLLLEWGDNTDNNLDCNENDSDAASTLTNTTDTDSHIYAVADPCDEVASIASSTFDCSESMTTLTRCPLVDMEEADCLRNVKRVRDMFEMGDKLLLHSSPSPSPSSSTSNASDHVPSLPPRNPVQSDKILKSDPLLLISPSKCHGEMGILKDKDLTMSPTTAKTKTTSSCSSLSTLPSLPSATSVSSSSSATDTDSSNGMLRSAYSSFNLHRLASYDFVDLLVNDRIVIEDSPDIFQSVRSTRQKQVGVESGGGAVVPTTSSSSTTVLGSKWKLGGGGFASGTGGAHNHTQPILRRSKSMGTGIFVPEESTHRPTPTTTILAEEIQPSWPAPNIVKNVRNVFEQLCLKNLKAGESSSSSSCSIKGQVNGNPSVCRNGPPPGSNLNCNFKTSANNNNNSSSNNNSCSIGKQFLSSVKSNPSSKIFRSESMRDNSNSNGDNSRTGGGGIFKVNTLSSSNRMVHTTIASQPKRKESLDEEEEEENEEQIALLSVSATTDGDKKVEEKKVETRTMKIRDESKSHSIVPTTTTPTTPTTTTSTAAIEKEERLRQVPRKLSEQIEQVKEEKEKRIELEESEPEMTEPNSLLSSIGEDEEPKWIPQEVLSRIRSHGTTTTYFGGEIVGKTVKNRKLLVSSNRNDQQNETTGDVILYSDSSSNGTTNDRSISEVTTCLSPVFTDLVMSVSMSMSSMLSTENKRPMTNSPRGRDSLLEKDCNQMDKNKDIGIESEEEPLLYHCGQDIDIESRSLDTVPRIVSVLPKSPSNSKSNSPSGSIIEGRNSPEGCESHSQAVITLVETLDMLKSDSNNNNISHNHNTNNKHQHQPLTTTQVEAQVQLLTNQSATKNGLNDFKFSEIAEGAWF